MLWNFWNTTSVWSSLNTVSHLNPHTPTRHHFCDTQVKRHQGFNKTGLNLNVCACGRFELHAEIQPQERGLKWPLFLTKAGQILMKSSLFLPRFTPKPRHGRRCPKHNTQKLYEDLYSNRDVVFFWTAAGWVHEIFNTPTHSPAHSGKPTQWIHTNPIFCGPPYVSAWLHLMPQTCCSTITA